MAQIREFESTTESYFILDGVSYPKVYEAMYDDIRYSDTKIKLVPTNRDTNQLVFSTEYTNIRVDGDSFDTALEAISRLNQVVFKKGGGSGSGGTFDGIVTEDSDTISFTGNGKVEKPLFSEVILADYYDENNADKPISAKITEDYLFGTTTTLPKSPFTISSYAGNWDNFNLTTTSVAENVIYIPNSGLPQGESTVTEISFFGRGNFEIWKSDLVFQNRVKIGNYSFPTLDKNNKLTGLNILLQKNERLGIKLLSGAVFRFSATPYAGGTFGDNTNQVESITIGLTYSGLEKKEIYTDGAIEEFFDSKTAQVIENLEVQRNNLNKLLFEDNFSATKPDWIPTAWNINNANQTFTSTTTGRNNRLFLNRIYNLNKRKATFKIIPSANTDFRIELRNGLTGVVDGESMFSVNFGEQKIKIFNVLLAGFPNANVESYGVSETSVLQEIPLDIPHVVGREYLIELSYNETVHTLSVIDTVTAKKTTLTQDGWVGGRQQQSYSFYVYAGGVVSMKDFKVFALESFFDVIFVGDSITEGVMVEDKSKRWWKLMEPYIHGKIAVCARGGQSVQDTLDKFKYELAILKPKYAFFMLGVNQSADATSAKYSLIKTLCEQNGIIPRFCYINAISGQGHTALNTKMITGVGLSSMAFKFHLSTSTNNDGINYNQTLYYDTAVHPKETGTIEMAKRIFIDAVEILK